MKTSRHIEPKAHLTFMLGLAFVVAGIAMTIVGWSEEHIWQTIVLQLSGLMFSSAVAVAIYRMIKVRNLRENPSSKFLLVRNIALGNIGLGALLYLIAFGLRYFLLASLGQFFIWIGVGVMFIYVAAGSVRESLAQGSSWSQEEVDTSLDVFSDDESAQTPRRAL
ncbi:MAG: hypothetical protein ACRDAX_07140 [Propionibacteriaceae bacterium]